MFLVKLHTSTVNSPDISSIRIPFLFLLNLELHTLRSKPETEVAITFWFDVNSQFLTIVLNSTSMTFSAGLLMNFECSISKSESA